MLPRRTRCNTPLSRVGCQSDRLTEVLQTCGVTQIGTCVSARAESHGGPREAKLIREFESAVSEVDALP